MPVDQIFMHSSEDFFVLVNAKMSLTPDREGAGWFLHSWYSFKVKEHQHYIYIAAKEWLEMEQMLETYVASSATGAPHIFFPQKEQEITLIRSM